MTLDYVALAILIAVALILFYGVIVIHDIPYEIAKERRHPHQGNDSNLLIVFYVQIMPDDFVMQLHRF